MKASLTNRRRPSSILDRWIYALKPASWPKLLVPTLLGQVLGATSVGVLNVVAVVWGLWFTLVGLGFIVLLNDWGDRHVDTIKRNMFPDDCSPKTIPDRILSVGSVGVAGAVFGLATLLVAAGSEVVLGRPWAFEAGAACMAVFAAYTLPPVRLNYRGGGEFLEMLGVGIALPVYNVYLQAGVIAPQVWPWVLGFAFLSLGGGIASGLSDEQSDRQGGKRTFASVLGNAVARRLTEGCVLLGAATWCLGAVVTPDWVPLWVLAPAIAILGWRFIALRQVSAEAVTDAFEAQGRYKHFLHGAIWHSTTVAALLLWLHMIVG
ncbi:MAG: prenyltransferase [Deltaproteobacteria bacterium]|nr:prenyltransferase [Deltaproteobacteria bacterium]